MAYRQVQLLAMVAAVACLAPLASATEFMVGDGLGWRARFNETHWADNKTFVVGDSLMFMYNKENHTVAQVGKDDFVACNLQGNQLKFWDSGNDVVTLDKPGKMWFICTKPGHCLNGMKLVIDVQAPASGPAAEPPSSAPISYTVGGAVAAAGAVLAAVLAF
ncbi:mavicyanin-like [Miscanthus floridulus]|uniref:mavicyanin-like n=1 Tax=Miscanthus floridulus TaxID=154761 RepID=UPI0034584BF0